MATVARGKEASITSAAGPASGTEAEAAGGGAADAGGGGGEGGAERAGTSAALHPSAPSSSAPSTSAARELTLASLAKRPPRGAAGGHGPTKAQNGHVSASPESRRWRRT